VRLPPAGTLRAPPIETLVIDDSVMVRPTIAPPETVSVDPAVGVANVPPVSTSRLPKESCEPWVVQVPLVIVNAPDTATSGTDGVFVTVIVPV
jgi:hypothetical protein